MMKGQALEINGQIGDDELALEIAEDSAVQFVVLAEALVVFELDSLNLLSLSGKDICFV